MNQKNKVVALAALSLLILIGIGYYALQVSRERGMSGEGVHQREADPDKVNALIERPFTVSAELDKEVEQSARETLAKLVEILKDDHTRIDALIDLSSIYLLIGDTEGAENILVYILGVSPQNIVALNNLADVSRMRGDFEQSERYLLELIATTPDNEGAYQKLYELYAYHFDERKDRADLILKEGIEEHPMDISLMIILARYYRAEGRETDAKVYYEKALAIVQDQSEKDAEKAILHEMNQR